MAYTRAELKSLEQIVKEHKYNLRYEKGNFNSGYCIVNSKKVIIINKFFKLKARIDVLNEIVEGLQLENISSNDSQVQLALAVAGQ